MGMDASPRERRSASSQFPRRARPGSVPIQPVIWVFFFFYFFCITLDTGPRRPVSLELANKNTDPAKKPTKSRCRALSLSPSLSLPLPLSVLLSLTLSLARTPTVSRCARETCPPSLHPAISSCAPFGLTDRFHSKT